MAKAEDYANWIVQNADKRGTPEFETVAQAYKAARASGGSDSDRVTKPAAKVIGVKPAQNWQNIGAESLSEAGLKDPTRDQRGQVGTTAQGLTLGAGDEIDAGLSALSAGLKGRPMGEAYNRQLGQSRAEIADYDAEHPIAGQANRAVGSLPLMLAPLPKTGAAGLPGAMLDGLLQGTALGGVSGFNSGEGGLANRLEAAKEPAAVGGLFGAFAPPVMAGAAAVGAKVRDLVMPEDAGARARALLLRDLERKGMSPDNAADAFAHLDNGELAPMDIAGDRLGRTVRTLPGKGREQIDSFLADRQLGQSGRVRDAVRGDLADPGHLAGKVESMQASQKAKAGPLYRSAEEANPAVSTPAIDDIMRRSWAQNALKSAGQKIENDVTVPLADKPALPAGKGPDAAKVGRTAGKQRNIVDAIRKMGGIRITDARGNVTKEGQDVVEALVKGGLPKSLAKTDGTGTPADNLYRQLASEHWFGRDDGAGGEDLDALYEALRQGKGFTHPEDAVGGMSARDAETHGAYLDEARSMADQLGVKWTRDMTPDDIAAAVDSAEHGAVSGAPADGKGFSLRTLDYVKRALQDHESEALRAGRGDDARLLKNMRQELTGAVDAADATGGDYAKARAIWGGVQKSLDAIEQGKGFLKLHPEEIQALMAKADEGDRPFLQMGAARALEDVTENTKLNLDSVARVNGSLRIGKQIEAMFGKNRSARFNESLTPEKIATQTNRTVRGGSNTADKLADIEDSSIADDVLEAMASHPTKPHHGVVKALARKPIEWALSQSKGMTPEVRLQLAKLLTSKGGEAERELRNLPSAVANLRSVKLERMLRDLPRLNAKVGVAAASSRKKQAAQ